jgi:hypothetical protein
MKRLFVVCLLLAGILPLAAQKGNTTQVRTASVLPGTCDPNAGQIVDVIGDGLYLCTGVNTWTKVGPGGGGGGTGLGGYQQVTSTIQNAVTTACALSPIQGVYIPANYTGTDSFTNSCGAPVIDGRSIGGVRGGSISVRDFGATGNSGFYPTVSVTAGATQVTINAVWKTGNLAAGSTIVIQGAGAAGDHSTTITSVSGGVIHFTAPTVTTVSNVGVWWGHDDTAAVQAAINFAHNKGGGTIVFPDTGGDYIISKVTVPAIDNSVTLKRGGITLECDGRRQSTYIVGIGADQQAMFEIAAGAHPTKVKGCAFAGFSWNTSGALRHPIAIDILGGIEHEITDNFFDSGLYNAIRATSTFNNRIDFNRFFGPWDSCIKFVPGASAVIDTRVTNNEFGVCGASQSHGYSLEQLSTGGGGSNWLYIHNNDCEGTQWSGCWYLKNVANGLLTGNRTEVDTQSSTAIVLTIENSSVHAVKNEFSAIGTNLGVKFITGGTLYSENNNYFPNGSGLKIDNTVGVVVSHSEGIRTSEVSQPVSLYSFDPSGIGPVVTNAFKMLRHSTTYPTQSLQDEFVVDGVTTYENPLGSPDTHFPGSVSTGAIFGTGPVWNTQPNYGPLSPQSKFAAWVCLTAGTTTCSWNGTSWTGVFGYVPYFTRLQVDGTAQPVSGTWQTGDKVRNIGFDGTSSTPYEWVNTSGGSPGTWKAVFIIDPASPGAIGGTTPAAITGTTVTATTLQVNGNANVSGSTTGTGAAIFNTNLTVNGPTVTNSILSSGAQKAPNQVSSNPLLAWYKADDGTSCTSNGASVTTWTDSSGNANNLTGGATKPTCQLNVINGIKPVLRFSGSANGMITGSALSSTAPWTIMVVYSKPVAATNTAILDTDTSVQSRYFWDTATSLRMQTSGNTTNGTVTDDGNPHVVIGSFANGTSLLHFDGTQKISSATTSGSLSQKLVVGSLSGQVNNKFVGDIAEVAVFSGQLSVSDRAALDTYVQNKYGVIAVTDYTQPLSIKNGSGTVVSQIDVNGKATLAGAATGLTSVSFSATPVFDASTTNGFTMTLTGNVTSSTLSNATSGQTITFTLCQDGTGSRSFVYPTNVKNGQSILSTASKCSRQSFLFDGTNANAIGPLIDDNGGMLPGGGGGGNTTSTALSTNSLPKANGANSVINSLVTDDGTTMGYTGTGGISTPQVSTTGPGAGLYGIKQGTAQATVANTIGLSGPTSVTAYNFVFPGAAGNGILAWTNVSNIVTGVFKSIQGTDANILSSGTVSGTGASLCTDANGGATTVGCPAGGSGYSTIMFPAGTSLTARSTLLVRDGLSASDDAGNTRTNLDLDIDQTIVFMQEDFCGGGGSTPNIGQYGWQLGGSGSGQYGPGNFGTAFPNLCLFRLDSSGTASTFAALGNPNISFGALGNAASWNSKFTFKLEQTTNTRSAVGFFLADANTKTLTATDWFGLRYDTNAGAADTSFKFTTCKASSCTTHGTSLGAVNTNFHTIRLYSNTAGEIHAVLDSGTDVCFNSGGTGGCTASANVSTSEMMPNFVCGNDTTAASSKCQVDAFKFKARALAR